MSKIVEGVFVPRLNSLNERLWKDPLWRKADIPFEIVSTSDKKVDGNGMRMRAIADSGPGNRAPPIYSRGLRQPLPSMTRLAPARSSQT